MKPRDIPILILFLVAFLLRCLFIDARGIQYDDAFSILLAQRSPVEIIQGTAADTMPPLYYLLLHYWMRFADQIWWYRLLSILLNIGTIILLFRIVDSTNGRQAAFWAVFFAAISPFQIYHAQDIRMYALAQFSQAAYFFAFIKLMNGKSPSQRYWVISLISGVAAFYSHNLASFFLLVPNIYLLLMRRWKLLKRFIVLQIGILILFIPWALYLPGQLEKIQTAFWTSKPGLLEVIQAIVTFTGSLTLANPFLQITAVMSIVFFFIIIIGVLRNSHIPPDNRLLFNLAIFWVPLVLFLLSYFIRPVFVPRAFLISSLFFYGLAGVQISTLKLPGIKTVTISMAFFAALLSLPNLYAFSRFPRSPFKAVTGELMNDFSEGEIILHDNKLSYFPARVYFPQAEQSFLADIPGSSNDTFAPASQEAMNIFPERSPELAIEGYDIVDFVVFSRTIREYEKMGLDQHPVLTLLENQMQLISIRQFEDLEIYRFVK